jgi:hypothetical protein
MIGVFDLELLAVWRLGNKGDFDAHGIVVCLGPNNHSYGV